MLTDADKKLLDALVELSDEDERIILPFGKSRSRLIAALIARIEALTEKIKRARSWDSLTCVCGRCKTLREALEADDQAAEEMLR